MHNRRNQVATKPRSPRGAKIPLAKPLAKPAPGFPCDIAIPPHRGASTTALLLPIPGLPARVAAQPLFALPEREPPERLRTPASSKPSKASTKPRKTSAKRRKPGGKGRKAKAALARPDPAAGLAAFALPRQQEPLVTAKPAPPPSQSRALAPHRPAGFVGQIGHWLNARAEALWQRLGGVSADQKSANAKELRRLRAENAKLRDQLEAFLALQQAAIPAVQTSAQGRALLPLA